VACPPFVVISALLMFLPAVAVGAWLSNSDHARNVAISPELQQAYLEEDFENYYSSEAARPSAPRCSSTTSRSRSSRSSAASCSATDRVSVIFNGANVGVAAGLFHVPANGPSSTASSCRTALLELSAIVVAGAAGLSLGWALIAPGEQTRARALANEGRRAVTILMGLVLAFIVAGIIEGFVTPSGLPTAMRVGIGALWGSRSGPTSSCSAATRLRSASPAHSAKSVVPSQPAGGLHP
jgi:hypothetical protein